MLVVNSRCYYIIMILHFFRQLFFLWRFYHCNFDISRYYNNDFVPVIYICDFDVRCYFDNDFTNCISKTVILILVVILKMILQMQFKLKHVSNFVLRSVSTHRRASPSRDSREGPPRAGRPQRSQRFWGTTRRNLNCAESSIFNISGKSSKFKSLNWCPLKLTSCDLLQKKVNKILHFWCSYQFIIFQTWNGFSKLKLSKK